MSMRRPAHRPRGAGFTLLELLLATALSTIAFGAVITMLGVIARDRQQLAASSMAEGFADEAVVSVIRRDLVNARRIQMRDDHLGFAISGYGAIEPATLNPGGRLARVTYAIRSGCLLRRQEYLDDRLQPQPWKELVATGGKSLELVMEPDKLDQPSEDEQAASDARPATAPLRADATEQAAQLRRSQRVGGRATLSITFAGRRAPIQAELVLR